MTFVYIYFSWVSEADESWVSCSPGSACLSFTRGRLTRTKWQNLLMAVWLVCVSPPICQTENKNIQSRKCRNELTQSEVGNVLNIQLTALTELTSTAAEDVYSGNSFFSFSSLLARSGACPQLRQTGNVSSNNFSFSPSKWNGLGKKYYYQITITFPNSIRRKFGQFKSHWPQSVALRWSEDAKMATVSPHLRAETGNIRTHSTDLNYFLQSHSQLPGCIQPVGNRNIFSNYIKI